MRRSQASAGTIFDLLPNAAVITDEPELLTNELDHFWETDKRGA